MVNLQTVVLGMPAVSCDSQANIMVSLCVRHCGSSGKIGPYSTQHTALIMETNGTET